ncbi:hypothetical protein [Hyphomicrobium sp. LHD-15]|uniref:hypothetical protein n=1 Tax=Hyphomicrobium sp. LHD-15 TaxID=3072142 RepID=UPI00280C663D|nr:hypothetical protein [Hyphomicrobium sp. LHD-15]MDQ8700617.1 hypothetical protein [Hyphomicrobium sp. LHD-15]
MEYEDDAVPLNASELEGVIWTEAQDLAYGFGGRWDIPAAGVHKAFDDIHTATGEVQSLVKSKLYDEEFRLLAALAGHISDKCEDLESTIREHFSRKAHRIAGAPYPHEQVYPYGEIIEPGRRVLRTAGKALNEVRVHDGLEDLFDAHTLLNQCEESCLSKLAQAAKQEELARRIDAITNACEALEESLRGALSRRARRQRRQNIL